MKIAVLHLKAFFGNLHAYLAYLVAHTYSEDKSKYVQPIFLITRNHHVFSIMWAEYIQAKTLENPQFPGGAMQ